MHPRHHPPSAFPFAKLMHILLCRWKPKLRRLILPIMKVDLYVFQKLRPNYIFLQNMILTAAMTLSEITSDRLLLMVHWILCCIFCSFRVTAFWDTKETGRDTGRHLRTVFQPWTGLRKRKIFQVYFRTHSWFKKTASTCQAWIHDTGCIKWADWISRTLLMWGNSKVSFRKLFFVRSVQAHLFPSTKAEKTVFRVKHGALLTGRKITASESAWTWNKRSLSKAASTRVLTVSFSYDFSDFKSEFERLCTNGWKGAFFLGNRLLPKCEWKKDHL